MKKQIRKAMICTIAMMVAAIVSLTGVTYAWFSQSDFATANGLEMSVLEADGGVYISKTLTGTYGPSITLEADPDTKYTSVSTAGNIDSSTGKLEFFEGTISHPDSVDLKTKKITAAGNYYIEQDVYFDNSAGTTGVTISLDGTTITPVKVGTVTKRVDLATRIAVVTHGSITKAQFAANDVPANTTNSDDVQILETNPLDHTETGRNEYTAYYMEKDPVTQKPKEQAPIQGFYDYYAVGAEATTAISRVNPSASGGKLVDMVNKKTSDTTANILKRDAKDVQFTVPAGSYLKITVYVWIEGQDVDCQNDVSGNSFKTNIRFTKVGSTAEMTTCPSAACGNVFAISDVVTKETEQEVGGETTTVTTKHCPKCDAEMPKVTCTKTDCVNHSNGGYYAVDAKTKDGVKVCPLCETAMPTT